MDRRLLPLLLSALCVCGCNALDGKSDSATSSADETPIFETAPDVASCAPGTLTAEYQTRIIERLNQIRLLHELPPVSLASAEVAPAQEAALAAVANAKLSHDLGTSSFCYSEDAARSSSESLLFLAAGNQVGDVHNPDRFMADWLRDSDVANLGHRRWMIDPFVTEVAFGFVQGTPRVDFPYHPVVGAALHVVDHADVDLSWWPNEFVAYPYGLYPASFVDKSGILSFSVVADHTKRLGNADKVSFASASLTVTGENGAALVANGISAMYDLTGVPNVLTWHVDGLTNGVEYTVQINGVTVDGTPRDFEYSFLLMP